MPTKMIPFPYEKKLLISISVAMVFTIPIKIDKVETFIYFISINMALGRMV